VIEVGKDTFTPFLRSLAIKMKPSQTKAYLWSVIPDLKQNVDNTFINQVYFTPTGQNPWQDLKQSTVKRRESKGTWYGMNGSILKEEYNLWMECKRNIQVKKAAGRFKARLFTRDKKALEHQEGRPRGTVSATEGDGKMVARPVYSLSPETINKFIVRTKTHFFGM